MRDFSEEGSLPRPPQSRDSGSRRSSRGGGSYKISPEDDGFFERLQNAGSAGAGSQTETGQDQRAGSGHSSRSHSQLQRVPQLLGSPRGASGRPESTRGYTRQADPLPPVRKLRKGEIGPSSFRSPSGTYSNREATPKEKEEVMADYEKGVARYERESGVLRRPLKSWDQLLQESKSEADEWNSKVNDIKEAWTRRS